jgi:hypothetical protein
MLKDQEMAIDSGEAKTQDFGTDFKGEFRYKSGISGKLEWERVNEITWKLTDGTFTNVPTSHGQWVIKRSR